MYIETYKNPIFVITQDENNKIKYYKIDKTNNYIKTKPFISDPVSTYFIYGCTETYLDKEKGKFLNKLDEKYCEIERENQKERITQNFKDIIKSITTLEHDIWDKKILKHHNNYYLVISLNVNLSSPYNLYRYDTKTNELIKICTFEGEDVMGIKIKE